ncbi:WcaI family glycosyltransferase [Pedobacter mucosus]|uniref:WcaI family glycosyltransferase n=1 Tax=Pedobacter mucosus TaxID=2895286 RepID=UPI001EE4ACDE|nr:WcaI family glycosyltransferase [Pedobacter mucosus]UKT62230.1 WcaI family glycosyltransferase [Pedobacter mucosus]
MKPLIQTKKRILLLGINFSPELTGIGKYSGEMMNWFVEKGYDCTVVTSFPYYPNWEIQKPYNNNFYKKEVLNDGALTVYRCPLYVPKIPTGMKRILNDATFFLSAFFLLFYLLFKRGNDYVFCVAPPFHLGLLGAFYNFFKGGKLIYHIQDLQIEAARDLNIIKSKRLFNILFGIEKFIMKQADFVCTISPGMLAKVSKKATQPIHLFPNWVDTEAFHPIEMKNELKKAWGFDIREKIVLYSGSIGEKQGLESLIPIAKSFQRTTLVKFIICGDGPYKKTLMEMATKENLTNLSFLPLQPKHIFNEFLNMTDVHLIIQKKNSCDLMMPSKLTAILSCGGLALVTAETGSTLHSIITEHDMGVVIDCENEVTLRKALLNCCLQDHSTKHINARLYAERFLNQDVILNKLMMDLESKITVERPVKEKTSIKEEFLLTSD